MTRDCFPRFDSKEGGKFEISSDSEKPMKKLQQIKFISHPAFKNRFDGGLGRLFIQQGDNFFHRITFLAWPLYISVAIATEMYRRGCQAWVAWFTEVSM